MSNVFKGTNHIVASRRGLHGYGHERRLQLLLLARLANIGQRALIVVQIFDIVLIDL